MPSDETPWRNLEQLEERLLLSADFNGDGTVDALDIDALFAEIRVETHRPAFDLTGDDRVEQDDAGVLIFDILATRPGDTNLDRMVSIRDLANLAAGFGAADAGWEQGDVNGDRMVTIRDLADLATHFGFGLPVIVAGLANDTAPLGGRNTDRITSDPTVSGRIVRADPTVPIVSFRAGLNDQPENQYVDLTTALEVDPLTGDVRFTLTESSLAGIIGGPLADGPHTLHLIGSDQRDNFPATALNFALDRAGPTVSLLTQRVLPAPSATIDVQFSEPMPAQAADPASYTLQFTTEELIESQVPVSGVAPIAGMSNAYRLTFAEPLTFNEYELTVSGQLTDVAGNTMSGTPPPLAFGIQDGSLVWGGLVNDTGYSSSDNYTSDASIEGYVTEPRVLARLLAGPSESPPSAYLDITSLVAPSGYFQFDPSLFFGAAAGSGAGAGAGGLVDGTYSLTLVLEGPSGAPFMPYTFSFTLDRSAPLPSSLDLSIGSDSGVIGDRQTTATIVTLVGQTDPNGSVRFVERDEVVLASSTGRFHLPSVHLSEGVNHWTLVAEDLAGNTAMTAAMIERVVEPIAQDAVLAWNRVALEAIVRDASSPPVASRGLAMVYGAMYDAVSAVEGTAGFFQSLTAPAGASLDAAAAGAAHAVLSYLYPAQAGHFDAALAGTLAAVPDGQWEDAGVQLGRQIAEGVIALRAVDGWDRFAEHQPFEADEAGQWVPTAPMYDTALLPQWADLTPFTIDYAGQFLPAGPPSLDSQHYADALNEVQSLGRADSMTRSAEQTQIARFWADGPGTLTPPGHWNAIAAQVAGSAGNSLSQNARLLAELNMALADAAIVAWDAKYMHNLWRPITAIHQAQGDGNDQTLPDETWRPLLITPPFPEYVSGHSTFSGAAARILSAEFGQDVAFNTDSLGLPGVTRSFDSFLDAAEEAGRSRIYGGIHYDFSNRDGLDVGAQIADHVLRRFNVTTDDQGPIILLDAPITRPTLAGNLTLAGRIVDNLEGPAGLQYVLDFGEAIDVPIDAEGRFMFTTVLPLDGSGDGFHVMQLTAVDHRGNFSDELEYYFIVDTAAPTIVELNVSDGQVLTDSPVLFGIVDGTGSSPGPAAYQLDGGPLVPLAFDPMTGRFGGLIDLSAATVGDHVLSIRVSDSAGHVAVTTLDIELSQRAHFVLEGVTPLPGSGDVGSTYRPQVFFSRPVDPATLNSDNFYAVDTAGVRLPATIVPGTDGRFAWLFFAQPLPGASIITVHVNGDTILAADDAVPLDADVDGEAGGSLAYRFSTVSLSPLPGTTLFGKVVDPGIDLKPMTYDDLRAGPDGIPHSPDDVFLNPLQGVKVHILGLEGQFVYTDAQGHFQLNAVPGGNIKLVIDGMAADNAPEGFYFPEMVMDLEIEIGRANTVMGTMGAREDKLANLDRAEVYLPRLQTSILQQVSDSETTIIGLNAEGAPNLTDQQRSMLTLQVPPGALIGLDGSPLVGGQVGVSTVPAELVRDMLPPGLLQHTFDITIQAPGVAVFAAPLRLTFPNLFNAPPGSKLNFLSFDHTTGRLVIEGTATVSDDGLSVATDPDTGITKPGWHGLTPPGSIAGARDATIEDVRIIDANNEEARLVINGLPGDIVTVNLYVQQGAGSALPPPIFSELSLCAPTYAGRGTLLNPSGWQQTLFNDGTFHFNTNGTGTSAFDLCGEVARQQADEIITRQVRLKAIAKALEGFSGEGMDRVVEVNVDDYISVARLQARLKFLQFPGFYGDPLRVDGNLVDILAIHTLHATQLFNAAINDFQHLSTASTSINASGRLAWINACNAPHWMELPGGGAGWANTDVGEDHDWGTSWTIDAIRRAGRDNHTGVPLPINDLSLKEGGDTRNHATHEAGMDIDVRLTAPGSWYDFATANAKLSISSPFWEDVILVDPSLGTINDAQQRILGGLSINTQWGMDRVLDSLYSHRMTSDAYNLIVRHIGNPNSMMMDAGAEFDAGFDILAGKRSTYNRDVTVGHIRAFNGMKATQVLFNDPVALRMVRETSGGIDFVIQMEAGHHHHIHVDVRRPAMQPPCPPPTPGSGSGEVPASTAAGFGNDPRLYYHFERINGGGVITGRSSAIGGFEVFLAPDSDYLATFYHAPSNRWTQYPLHTEPTGAPTPFDTIYLDQVGGTDADGDGIPDMGELAIGTDATLADTDGDGVTDSAELAAGLDPLGGRPFVTGVVASVPLMGAARQIVIEGSITSAETQTAYIATTQGLAIVDATQFTRPIVLSQIALGGVVTDVSVDSRLGLAAVAVEGRGLLVVDVNDPLSPFVARAIPVLARHIELIDGVAYVEDGTRLASYDLISGEELYRLAPQFVPTNALARDGAFLYTIDQLNELRVFETSGGLILPRGSLTMPITGSLFVGGDVAYVSQFGGYATADVSDPTEPVLLSDVDDAGIVGISQAANGSGLAVSVGFSFGPKAQILDVSDPTRTDQLVTQYALPFMPSDVTIAAGLAWIVGDGGLQVVNYMPFDGQGVAPTVALDGDAIDADAMTPGVQVVEGSTVAVRMATFDDVQVRNVELLLDGLVVRNDASFPFELSAALPALAAGSSIVTLQARAYDTGGNVALSDTITVELTPDLTPPTLETVLPIDGAVTGSALRTVTLVFSEPMDRATFSAESVRLIGPTGPVTPAEFLFTAGDRVVNVIYPPLELGEYQIEIDAEQITDRPGNPLGDDPVISHFEISNIARWANPAGGFWDDPNNWAGGVLPGPADDVIIDMPGEVTVTHVTGDTRVHSILSNNPLTIVGGTLTVDATIKVNHVLTLAGGTLVDAQMLPGDGSATFAPGVLGNALVFDGVDDHVTVGRGEAPHLSPGEQYTIETWVRLDQMPAPNSFVPITSLDAGGERWLFGYQSNENGIGFPLFHLSVNSGDHVANVLSDAWSPSVGVWHHLAVVRTRAEFGGDYVFYADGQVIGQGNASFVPPRRGGEIRFGALPSHGVFLAGSLDEMRIWNIARSQSDIAAAMNMELAGDEPGLVGYWPMNEADGFEIANRVDPLENGFVESTPYDMRIIGSSTLDSVTLDVGPLTVSDGATVNIVNGLVLNGRLDVIHGVVQFMDGDQGVGQSFSGSGILALHSHGGEFRNQMQAPGAALTIGPDISVRGGGTISNTSQTNGRIINEGEIAPAQGATLHVTGGTLTNVGVLRSVRDAHLIADNLIGDLNAVTLADAGSQLTLGGDYVINFGLTASPGQTLTLNGTWSNPVGIVATDATVNLGGEFTMAELDQLDRSGGTLNITGVLGLGGQTLALDAPLAPLNLAGGAIRNGVITSANHVSKPWTPGQLNAALPFDGVDDHVDMGDPNDNHLDLAASFTLEAWVRFDTIPNSAMATIMSKDDAGLSPKWFFGYARGTNGMPNNTFLLISIPQFNPAFLRSNPWTPIAGQWYHLAVVKSGSTFTFYRNGVVDGVVNSQLVVPDVLSNFVLGQAEGGNRLHGALDDVRAWNVARSTQQIADHFATELAGDESGLVGYWPMNEGQGDAAADLSPHQTHGAIGGVLYESLYFTAAGGTLDAITADMDLNLASVTSSVSIRNGLVLNGVMRVGDAIGTTSAQVNFEDSGDPLGQTISGNGMIVLGGHPTGNRLTAARLTVDSGITIRGKHARIEGEIVNHGVIQAHGVSGTLLFDGPMTNHGTIRAEGADETVRVDGSMNNFGAIDILNGAHLDARNLTGDINTVNLVGTGSRITLDGTDYVNNLGLHVGAGQTLTLRGRWSNPPGSMLSVTSGTLDLDFSNQLVPGPGVVEADNATVNLRGTVTQAALNAFNRVGGTVNLIGMIQGGLTLDATTGTWNLAGGTIEGGTLSLMDGQTLVVLDHSLNRLSNVTLNGDLDLTVPNAALRIAGGLTINGNLRLVAEGASLGVEGTQTWRGGNIVFNTNTFMEGVIAGETLTFAPDLTVELGHGVLLDRRYHSKPIRLVNQGSIVAQSPGTSRSFQRFADMTEFVNEGSIAVSNNASLTINPVAWNNVAGTISVNGGTLGLGGAMTTAGLNIPAISRTGGAVHMVGVLDNTGDTLTLDAATGPWMLGGTIRGGTVNSPIGPLELLTGGVAFFNTIVSVATFDSVTLNGNVNVYHRGRLDVVNGLVLNGDIVLQKPPGVLANFTVPLLRFSGTQTLSTNIGGRIVGLPYDNLWVEIQAQNGTATFGPGITVETALSNGTVDLIGNFINEGVIRSHITGGTIQMRSGAQLTNHGILETANGGNMTLRTVTNAGQINPGGAGAVGVIQVIGNFVQTAAGVLNIDIAGTADNLFDRLLVSGSATLDGVVNVALLNSFLPMPPQAFAFLTHASRLGTFSTVNDLDPEDQIAFALAYNSTNVSLITL